MRHRCKVNHLARPADQRKALLRTLATSLCIYDEITTTSVRAKALQQYVARVITLAKRGDLHAIRQVSKLIFHSPTGKMLITDKGREIPETVLRRIFSELAPRFESRQGGYTRVIKMPPRRGDAAPMAMIQFTFELESAQKEEALAVAQA
jgi:large subunit ribosomal protein L17